MTFPAILYATDHPISGLTGLAVGVVLALKKGSLLLVAAASCGSVLLVELLLRMVS